MRKKGSFINISILDSKVNHFLAIISGFSYFEVPFYGIYNCCVTEADPIYGTEKDQDTDVLVEHPAKVILFNDEEHTFDEVIGQIIKATGCDVQKAEALTWEVHTAGKAMVYQGEMTKCVQVSGVLEEIELMTQIEV